MKPVTKIIFCVTCECSEAYQILVFSINMLKVTWEINVQKCQYMLNMASKRSSTVHTQTDNIVQGTGKSTKRRSHLISTQLLALSSMNLTGHTSSASLYRAFQVELSLKTSTVSMQARIQYSPDSVSEQTLVSEGRCSLPQVQCNLAANEPLWIYTLWCHLAGDPSGAPHSGLSATKLIANIIINYNWCVPKDLNVQ